jgi:hypothetical protein
MSQINFNAGQSLIVSPAGGKGLVNPGTGTYVSAIQNNMFRNGVKLVVDITAISGSATLTVTIQGYDQVSGKFYTILTSAALAATATTVLTVYPSIAAAANTAANDVLPTSWRVQAVVAVAGTVTATIGAALLV